ncbi:MAG: hypothetical protein IIT65_09900, partial [Lachnospiraceae bacterium]|nr:hypothetical protein [Lachnospiraceae bacterium]
CYSGCSDPSFDILELTQKIFHNQKGQDIDLNDAVRYLAIKFNIEGDADEQQDQESEEWQILNAYARQPQIELKDYHANLKEYDAEILKRFNYDVKIDPWLRDNIGQEALDFAQISFYPGNDQIVIPHFDIDGKLVGIRGRTLVKEDAERFGKYRPLYVNHTLYSHPLGFNLYGINWAKENIKTLGKAIVFESEKSVLQYMTYFGIENSIAVACCGSNFSLYQLQLLKDCNVKEIVIAFDRQWESKNSEEQRLWDKKLIALYNKLKSDVVVSFIYDKDMLTGYKDSPTDNGGDIFMKLFLNRKYIKEK